MGTDSVGNCAETSSGKRFAFLLVFGRAAMGNAGMAAVFSRLGDTTGTSTAWFGHTVGLSTQPLLTAVPSPAIRAGCSHLFNGKEENQCTGGT